jgi:hypothetical protein
MEGTVNTLNLYPAKFRHKWAVKWRQRLFLWLGVQPIDRSTGEEP